MTYLDAISLGREAMWVVLLVTGPALIFGLVVGLVISVFQAVTQIQEPTLAFIPKILAVGIAILLFGPFMLAIMTDFMSNVISNVGMYLH
ncbi:MAG TPA: flagellar biosynthesis protein FliQ [Candidatus Dormibacteraeota bacterium]|nr:flagellar biosynthesis protein FliQ [Candidatus Dormibacteraeota bacterium]